MNTYIITMKLNKEELISLIDLGGPFVSKASIKVTKDDIAELAPELVLEPTRRGAPRGPRGSKVNDSILRRLRSGEQTTKELRAALEDDGLAPGSLSTGLAILQRQGQVERIGDGVYALKMAKAAE